MPAYGSALSPAETAALVRFLDTLHPNYQQPSQDASRQVVGQGGEQPPAR
jgi:ubiquinol-cytochrome c reductase cytochrome b subunit